jgi:CAAX prenyl protease-like protein
LVILGAVDPLTRKLRSSPVIARAAPFVIFLALTFCQGQFGEASRYWLYAVKTIVGVWLVWVMRPVVAEMRWAFSWEAVVVGVAVCAMWVGIDDYYPKIGKAGAGWNPHAEFGQGSALAWFMVAARLFGSTVVVPPLEEVFYRSFLYRSIIKADFQSVPLGTFNWLAFVVASIFFGFEHSQWLAGILCGLAYQGLACWKNRLGDAMTAHAITNGLLGVWVLWKGAWNFW